MRVVVLGLCLVAGCASVVAPEPDPAALLWAEACVRVSGCEPYASTPDPLFACRVSRFNFHGTGPAECALAAADCETAVACFGAGTPPAECPTGAEPRCEGDVLVGCDLGVQLELARDCAAEGLACRVNDFGQAHCARAGACTEGACDGDVPVHCFGGIPVPWECGIQRCVELAGGASCAGEGEPCEAPLSRCDGDVAVSCQAGFIAREQCRPGACSTTDGAFCRETDECRIRCEGTAVVFCVEGALERYDCTDWGFTECVEDASSATAACR